MNNPIPNELETTRIRFQIEDSEPILVAEKN